MHTRTLNQPVFDHSVNYNACIHAGGGNVVRVTAIEYSIVGLGRIHVLSDAIMHFTFYVIIVCDEGRTVNGVKPKSELKRERERAKPSFQNYGQH